MDFGVKTYHWTSNVFAIVLAMNSTSFVQIFPPFFITYFVRWRLGWLDSRFKTLLGDLSWTFDFQRLEMATFVQIFYWVWVRSSAGIHQFQVTNTGANCLMIILHTKPLSRLNIGKNKRPRCYPRLTHNNSNGSSLAIEHEFSKAIRKMNYKKSIYSISIDRATTTLRFEC